MTDTARRPAPPDPGLGFGVVAGLPPDLLQALARGVADLGYGAFWINDAGRPDADGLAGLAVVAEAAPSLRLGVGVLPLDRRTPEQIAREVADLRLPLERLWLGVGSGSERASPLRVVRDGVAGLRALVPDARLVIAALGPRMCALAGEVADGVLFNWATPERLASVSAIVADAARAAGRPPLERWTYVRAVVGPDARERLGEEGRRYARSVGYGAALDAMGVPLDTVGLAGDRLAAQVTPYRAAVDGVVIRALPHTWTVDEALAIAAAAVTP